MAKKTETETETAPDLAPVDSAAAAEVAAMTPAEAPKGISEDEIRERTRVGLTRDQAIQSITLQREHDAALAKQAKAK
jgi:hypothetical protein